MQPFNVLVDLETAGESGRHGYFTIFDLFGGRSVDIRTAIPRPAFK